MKVFFTASAFLRNYDVARRIYRSIENLGYQHTFDFVIKLDVNVHKRTQNIDYWANLYSKGMRSIALADICVIEASVMSTGLGQLLQEAVRKEKPVIILTERGYSWRGLINGAQVKEKRIQIVDYDQTDLEDVLKDAFIIARDLLTVRFTMLLSPEYIKHMDLIYSEEGISRSEYIRSLIRKDMERRGK